MDMASGSRQRTWQGGGQEQGHPVASDRALERVAAAPHSANGHWGHSSTHGTCGNEQSVDVRYLLFAGRYAFELATGDHRPETQAGRGGVRPCDNDGVNPVRYSVVP